MTNVRTIRLSNSDTAATSRDANTTLYFIAIVDDVAVAAHVFLCASERVCIDTCCSFEYKFARMCMCLRCNICIHGTIAMFERVYAQVYAQVETVR
jgi:hypothetical protein